MIILDNYSNIDTKILFDPKSWVIEMVDDDLYDRSNGVGGFVENEFIGVYGQNDRLIFCYKGENLSEHSGHIECSNIPISNEVRQFRLLFSGSLVCDLHYKRNANPIMAFGDDEIDYDFLLYLSTLLVSEERIDKFIKSCGQ